MENIDGNYWEIIDENGVIHSGTEMEMDSAWDVIVCNSLDEYYGNMAKLDIELINPENIQSLTDTYYKYQCEFKGDLKLIEVHKIHR